jgi:hypothetical protein
MARGIVQEKNLWLVTHSPRKIDHSRAKIVCVPIQEDLACQPSPSVPSVRMCLFLLSGDNSLVGGLFYVCMIFAFLVRIPIFIVHL